MFVVDTNILIYAANKNSHEYNACRLFLERVYRGADLWYLSWGIIYEFLRVITHHRVISRPWDINDAWQFIRVLMKSPGFEILQETGRHEDFANEILNNTPGLRGNILFDFHTAVLMKENGIRKIYTRDTHFHRFTFLEVIDPLMVRS